ncbi:MurR/RpiR family transcriptional regulator [Paraburkholderia megapolitana]|uniref:Transcriptional regulator, RpiR family n=1 Tax=Paraburkholderia megapolitana TaxID=420953 RepID=A0A1I3L6Z5_9BURK|nr:MurR/RpiR family transcriptional regulator [Paraburkholderia megapolitana]QDQ80591.1 MurR/RpiR family transcriptional regulator [Paraburkholderia megapolitana]SFI80563.1 transcriptional regulator, RpiR family [Paraburkholderia megapolitana]
MAKQEPDSDLFALIRARLPELADAQRSVARVFLDDPEWAMQAHVSDIAARAGVSDPTVGRFCRAVGYEGLREFKLQVAQQIARGSAALHRTVTAKDSVGKIVSKVLRSSADSLLDVERQLPLERIERAIAALVNTARVDCYGVGTTSGFIATDAQSRLVRMGLHAQAYTDANMQLFSAATLGPSDVVIAISHFGRMPFLLEAVAVAKERGAIVIGICEPGTPLADASDIALTFSLPPSVNVYVGSDACLAHLAIIDILIVGVTLRRGATSLGQLRRLQDILSPHGLEFFPTTKAKKRKN